jgi:hypothetical protein
MADYFNGIRPFDSAHEMMILNANDWMFCFPGLKQSYLCLVGQWMERKEWDYC